MRIPSRSSPIVFEDLVFVMTHDNQLYAVNKDQGEVMWTHRGILEPATILSSTSSVAIDSGWVFVLSRTGSHQSEINSIQRLDL